MLTYYLFRIALVVLPHIPPGPVFWLCCRIADLAFLCAPGIRRNVVANLRRVLPDSTPAERTRIARRIVRNNVTNYYDLLRMGWLTRDEVLRQIDLRGVANLRAAESYGKGIIIAAAHTGSFSFADQVAEGVNITFNLLVEPIQPPQLFDLVAQLRSTSPRTTVIPIGGPALRDIFRALKRNEMVCFALDRDVSNNGTPLPFFGEIASMPTGAAEVALRTGAPIVPVALYRVTNTTHVLELLPPFLITPEGAIPLSAAKDALPPAKTRADDATIRRGALAIIAVLEEVIRAHPDQWVVLQPLWPDTRI